MKRRISIAWMALVCAAACSDPAYVAGNYTAAITNGADPCSIGWTANEMNNATMTVTQSGSDVTLIVNGLPGLYVATILGTNTFIGDVDGTEVNVVAMGTAEKMSGGCTYTYNGKVIATQEGDDMAGRVEYRAATNGHADCATRQDCVSKQAFNATRPPPVE
jgi:hypothetical protein